MKIKILTIVVLFTFAFISCKNDTQEAKSEAKTEVIKSSSEHHGQASVAAVEGEEANALQVAKSLPDFTTLVVAIEAASVQDAVVNVGPLTIFAPVNGAF
ncbi:MAG: fasciclin domain-containing protein, partial [Bacteroidetes bacterium]